MTQLTVLEGLEYKARLARCLKRWNEADAGWKGWLAEVKPIRDKKLYRHEFSTFEEFCEKEFGITHRRVNQMLQSAFVMEQLPPEARTVVPNEGVARELTNPKLPVDKRAEVVSRAGSNGEVTVKSVRREIEKIINAEPPSKDTEPAVPVDEMGFPLPEVSIPFWNRRDEIQSLMSHVSAVRGALKRYQDDKDQMLCDLHNALSQQLATVYLSLADRKPYAVCPYCDGTFEYTDEYGHHDCKACHQTGLMAKALYEKVPPQFKAGREKALK